MQTRLVDLVLNLLRKAQYQGTTPSADELYLVTDDYGVTSADVINALGYTPYNASNPDGYLNTQTVGDATVNFKQDNMTVGSLTTNQTQDSNITIRGLYDYYYLDLISVGTPTIINAIVSDFSTTNYVKMKTTYTMPSGWELWLNFTTGYVPSESDDNYQYLIGGDTANPDFAVFIDDSDMLTIKVGATLYTPDVEFQSNKTYNLRIIWGYTEVYESNPNEYCIELYDGDMQYITDEFISNATSPSTVNLFFGYSSGAATGFKGSIDFSKTYINKIESGVPSLWWKPVTLLIDTKVNTWDLENYTSYAVNADIVGAPTIDGTVMSGFSSANYAVSTKTFNFGTIPWELWIEFTTDDINGFQYIFYGDRINLYLDSPNPGTLGITLGGTSTLFGSVSANTTYKVRIVSLADKDYNGTSSTNFYLYDENDNLLASASNNNILAQIGTLYFGVHYSNGASSPFNGSINFENTYINLINTNTKTTIRQWTGVIPLIDTKADVNGSNMVSSVKNFDGGWVHSMSYLINSTTSLAAQTSRSFDLSSYLPNDNYQYEVIVSVTGTTSTTSGQTFNTWFKSDIFTSDYSFVGTRVITRTSSSMNSGTTVAIPVGTGRSIAIYNGSSYAGSITELWLSGYRRIGTNQ